MVAEARRLHPGVEFQEGDAEELPFDAGCFDAVVMGFGLLHMPRPERAVAEAHRVLRPQGRFALTVWAQPDQAVGLALVLQAIQRHGDLAVPLPAGPPFFRFSDPAECERVLCEGGFSTPQVTVVPQVWRLRAPEDLMEIMLHGTVRTAALLKAQDARALERIRRDVVDAAAAYRHGDAVELPMPAVLAQAVKR
jgi:SAM-dependent methyltransferase